MKIHEYTLSGHRFLIQEDTDGHTWNHMERTGYGVIEEGKTFPTAAEAQADSERYADELAAAEARQEQIDEEEAEEDRRYGSYEQQVRWQHNATRL